MKKNPFAQLTIIVVVISMLAAAGVSHAAAPVSSQSIELADSRSGGISANVPEGLSADEWSSMQDLMRQAEYQFNWQVSEGAWAFRAPNRAHDLSLSLGADGLLTERYSIDGELLWDFALSLSAYGEQNFPAAIGEGSLSGSSERVEYQWSQDVVEWYINRAEGLEHGLTLAAPPIGSDGSTVELSFALRGSLTPELDSRAQTLHLKDTNGRSALLYDKLAVYDAHNHFLPAHFSLSPGGEGQTLHITIDTSSAVYPLTVDPLLHDQAAKLSASDAQDGDEFGGAVAISGDTLVVGAHWENGTGYDRGAAYVFERNKNGADIWGQVKKLTASDAEDYDSFGNSVAISADTIVVGAVYESGTGVNRGAAYVFERNSDGAGGTAADNWGEVKKLTASDAADFDNFSWSVSISGDTVVVGAPYEDGAGSDRGAAYVYARNSDGSGGTAADNWGQVKKLSASDTADDDSFGGSVSISGDTIVAGASAEDGAGSDQGAAYVFKRNSDGSGGTAADNWGQVKKLTASDPENDDFFGFSVAISADTVVIGAPWEDDTGSDRGAAYIYERNQNGVDNWGEVIKLTDWYYQDYNFFGTSVAISVDTVVIGADGKDNNRGVAHIYERNQGEFVDLISPDEWGHVQMLTASDPADEDYFGASVAISGENIVVGAPGEDGAGSDSGAAYVYVSKNGQWYSVSFPTASDAADDDKFGNSVSISGDTVVIGAYWKDVSFYDDRGAAYIFERNSDGAGGTSADNWGQVTKLTASDPAYGDNFGYSVSISADTVVIGAAYKDGAGIERGAAYVFKRNQGGADNWGHVKKLSASDAADYDSFGYSVSISGDTIIIGAWGEDGAGSNRGAAYVFERNSDGAGGTLVDNWGQVKKLTASTPVDGDLFGYSVSISTDTVVIASPWEDGAGFDRGAAYIFKRNQGGADNWGQARKLSASDPGNQNFFGISLAISGDIVVVGSSGNDGGGSDRGAAYVYERNQGGADSWGQIQRLIASDAEDGDYFGSSVAISADIIIIGAELEDGGGSARGAAYVFERNQGGADSWGQFQKLTAFNAEDVDYFGSSVAISGNNIVIGAPEKDGAGSDRGAAYIFTLQPIKVFLPQVIKDN